MEAIDIGKISNYSIFKLELHTGANFRLEWMCEQKKTFQNKRG